MYSKLVAEGIVIQLYFAADEDSVLFRRLDCPVVFSLHVVAELITISSLFP